ncbi:MAG: hypothetical protein M1834_009707 [Cirrosporium novae-zelandiae]|nr:MAG: hypothetical protein M1834_009707 [Cirrosporium novae-zelandiae]
MAVAAGEDVRILIPKYMKADPRNPSHGPRKGARGQYDAVQFQINIFSMEEWSPQEPMPIQDSSIGEEQTLSTVTALAWSPPGLAKNRRSLLALLTSNLVLSIWECTSSPVESTNWKRVLVINHTIENYFQALINDATEDTGTLDPMRRRKRRIRSFSWSQAWHPAQTVNDSKIADNPSWGIPILAIANDDNDIILVRLRRPYRPFQSPRTQWKAEVLEHFSVDGTSGWQDNPSAYSILGQFMQRKRFVQHLTWSGWSSILPTDNSKPTQSTAFLVYLVGSTLQLCRVTIATGQADSSNVDQLSVITRVELPGSDFGALGNTYNFSGPLRWCSSHGELDKDKTIFAIAAQEGFAVLTIPNLKVVEFVPFNSSSIDPPEKRAVWEPTTGLAFTTNSTTGELFLHISTLLSYIRTFKVMQKRGPIQFQSPALQINPEVGLQQAIESGLSEFDLDKDLGGFAICKTWGMASYEDKVAACVTYHPGDCVEYNISSQERSTIIIGSCEDQESNISTILTTSLPEINPRLMRHLVNIFEYPHSKLRTDDLGLRIFYSAACAAILHFAHNPQMMQHCKKAFLWIQSITDLDMSQELDLCKDQLLSVIVSSSENNFVFRGILPKSNEQLANSEAASLFDVCGFCGKGLGWLSSNEAHSMLFDVFVNSGA